MYAFTTLSAISAVIAHPSFLQSICARRSVLRPTSAARRVLVMMAETSETTADSQIIGESAASDGGSSTSVMEDTTTDTNTSVRENDGKRGILMLCSGNICRSPAAEAILKGMLAEKNLQDKFFVDSCGTGGGSPDWYMEDGFSHHEGYPADTRMTYSANKRGIKVDSISRPLRKEDFDRFEWIIAMDSTNIESIETARAHWGVEDPKAKVVLISEFSKEEEFKGKEVPDPYWSKQNGFEDVLDLLQESCAGLVDSLASA